MFSQLFTYFNTLTNLLQESFNTFALSVICSYAKELLRRLIQTTAATTPSLSRLVASLFTHHTSSPDCQAIVNHTISCIASIYPASVKDHRSVLIEWTKKGLYSGHVGLVKVFTCICVCMYVHTIHVHVCRKYIHVHILVLFWYDHLQCTCSYSMTKRVLVLVK